MRASRLRSIGPWGNLRTTHAQRLSELFGTIQCYSNHTNLLVIAQNVQRILPNRFHNYFNCRKLQT